MSTKTPATRGSILLAALLAMFLALPGSAARILSITLSEGVSGPDNAPVNAGDRFSADVPEIHAVVELDDVPAGTTVKGAWIAVDAIATPNYEINAIEESVPQAGRAQFHTVLGRPDKGWPPGNYRVLISIDGRVTGAGSFAIVAAQPAAPAQPAPAAVAPPATTTQLTATTTQLTAITLSEALGPDATPQGVTDRFTPDASAFYATASINGARAGTRVKASWIAVDAGPDPNYEIAAKEMVLDATGEGRVNFSLSRPDSGWPVGGYRVVIAIDDRPVGAAAFRVVAPAATPQPAAPSAPAPAAASPPSAPAATPITAPVMIDAPPAVDPRAEKIERLLAEADRAFSANRLTTPAGRAAADYYRQVLELDAGNARAAAGIERIVERYLGWYRAAAGRGEAAKANGYRAKIASLDPARTPPKIEEPPASPGAWQSGSPEEAVQEEEERTAPSDNPLQGVWDWLKQQHEQLESAPDAWE